MRVAVLFDGCVVVCFVLLGCPLDSMFHVRKGLMCLRCCVCCVLLSCVSVLVLVVCVFVCAFGLVRFNVCVPPPNAVFVGWYLCVCYVVLGFCVSCLCCLVWLRHAVLPRVCVCCCCLFVCVFCGLVLFVVCVFLCFFCGGGRLLCLFCRCVCVVCVVCVLCVCFCCCVFDVILLCVGCVAVCLHVFLLL